MLICKNPARQDSNSISIKDKGVSLRKTGDFMDGHYIDGAVDKKVCCCSHICFVFGKC